MYLGLMRPISAAASHMESPIIAITASQYQADFTATRTRNFPHHWALAAVQNIWKCQSGKPAIKNRKFQPLLWSQHFNNSQEKFCNLQTGRTHERGIIQSASNFLYYTVWCKTRVTLAYRAPLWNITVSGKSRVREFFINTQNFQEVHMIGC